MKELFKLTFSVCVFLGWGSILMGQNWYSPGYLIDNSGDTVRGYLSDRSLGQNSKAVMFKDLEGEKEKKTWLPGEIHAYYLETGKLYQTMVLPNGQRSFSEPESSTIFYDTVFAAVVLTGEFNLYAYRDQRDYYHIYFEKDGKLRELVEVVPEGFEDNADLFGSKDMLHSLFTDCPDIERELNNAPIKPIPQQKLFVDYNDCSNKEASSSKFEFDRLKLRPHILLGANLANCKFRTSGNSALDNVVLDYRPQFSGGVGFELGNSKESAPISMTVDVLLQSLDTEGSTIDEQGGFSAVEYQWDLSMLSLKLPILVRYSFSSRRVTPFIELGGAFGWRLKFDFTQYRTNYFSNGDSSVIDPRAVPAWEDPLNARRMEQSIIAGIGLEIGRFTLRSRYERGNGFSALRSWKTTTQSWQLLGGFSF